MSAINFAYFKKNKNKVPLRLVNMHAITRISAPFILLLIVKNNQCKLVNNKMISKDDYYKQSNNLEGQSNDHFAKMISKDDHYKQSNNIEGNDVLLQFGSIPTSFCLNPLIGAPKQENKAQHIGVKQGEIVIGSMYVPLQHKNKNLY